MVLECFGSKGVQAGHKGMEQVHPGRLPHRQDTGLPVAPRELYGRGRASRTAGRRPYCTGRQFPAGLMLYAESSLFVLYHCVFICFIFYVNVSHEKKHEMLCFRAKKKYYLKQLVEKQICMTRKRLFDGSGTFSRFLRENA